MRGSADHPALLFCNILKLFKIDLYIVCSLFGTRKYVLTKLLAVNDDPIDLKAAARIMIVDIVDTSSKFLGY